MEILLNIVIFKNSTYIYGETVPFEEQLETLLSLRNCSGLRYIENLKLKLKSFIFVGQSTN